MKFIIKWVWYAELFIGIGLILSKEMIGITISNLFIGFTSHEDLL
jgi:hypothetical protein